MNLILRTFDAMHDLGRPASRAEIEQASGLSTDGVWTGLRGLIRRGLVIVIQEAGRRGMYALTRQATRPEDLRGAYERDEDHRRRMKLVKKARRQMALAAAPAAGAAARPTHVAQPGALRVIVKGVLDVRRHAQSFGHCSLADVWKKPR